MKFTCVYLIGFFLIATSAWSQENIFRTITYGVEAGYTNGQFSTHYIPEASPNSFYAGINAHIEIPGYFIVKGGLVYSNAHNLSKLHLPVMAKMFLANQLSIVAGPQLSAVLNSSSLRTFGLDIGAGLSYDITERLFVEGRYHHELTNRLGGVRSPDTDLFGRYNSIFLGVGYQLF